VERGTKFTPEGQLGANFKAGLRILTIDDTYLAPNELVRTSIHLAVNSVPANLQVCKKTCQDEKGAILFADIFHTVSLVRNKHGLLHGSWNLVFVSQNFKSS
jgi:hypothetical protein